MDEEGRKTFLEKLAADRQKRIGKFDEALGRISGVDEAVC